MKRNLFKQLNSGLAAWLACLALCAGLFGAPNCVAQTAPPALPPGVQDVVKLAKAGMTDEVILAQIRAAGATYNLNADQLIYLSGQGVSQSAIKALIGAGAPVAAVNPVPVPVAPAPPAAPAPVPAAIPAPVAPPAPLAPAAPAAASYDTFHSQLAPYGSWIEDPAYGPVWRPAVAATDPYWRPYLDAGHWVYTDAGWSWQSEYPWGEIAFHYGRWHFGGLGWVWVPAYDWAPAWVTWRHSDGYIGWAPLPPTAVFRAGVGLEFGGRLALDIDFDLGPDRFAFVPYDRFWEPHLHGFILPRERVDFVFRHSVIANGYRLDHGRFFVEGLGRERVAGYTRHEIRVEHEFFHDSHSPRRIEGERRGGRDDRRDFR